MIAEILRIAVAAYFLFSGVNKIFFFDRFSKYVVSFFNLPDGIALVLSGIVIGLEILFAIVVLFWSGKLLPRIFALALALPFIAYNLWIFFVLGLSNCNCTYSASGESMTSPLFSIAVLVATLAAVFYFTTVRERVLHTSAQIGVLLLVILATAGFNAVMWHQYQTSDLVALRQMIFDQVAEEDRVNDPAYEVFIQLPKGRPSRSATFLQNLLQKSDSKVALYILRTESVKLVDDMMLGMQSDTNSQIIDPPENGRLEHLGIEIYQAGSLVYRNDQLPEMKAAEYEKIIEVLSEQNEELSSCDRPSNAGELLEIVRRHITPIESETPRIGVHLLMERTCADCDADLLAMLDGYFYETERFEVNIAYLMSSNPEDGRGVSIPPTELANLQHWCIYPNKLLLLEFGRDDVVALPVSEDLGNLDQAINAEFERRGLSLF